MNAARGHSLARQLACVTLAACVAGMARAEVLLVPSPVSLGRPSVEVLATARGPWSAAIGSKMALNPQGDLMADGFPAIAVGPDAAVVAWSRPLDGSLQLAAADSATWVGTSALPANVLGTPVAWLLSSGAVIAWTDVRLGDSAVRIAASDRRALITDVVNLGPGRVLDSVAIGPAVWLLWTDGSPDFLLTSPIRLDNQLGGAVVVMGTLPFPIPIERAPLGFAPVLFRPFPLPALPLAAGRSTGAHIRRPPLTAPPPPFGDAKLNVIDRRGEEVVVVTVWSAPDALTFSELSEFGIVGATETITAPAGYAPYSPDLVRWALQAVASR